MASDTGTSERSPTGTSGEATVQALLDLVLEHSRDGIVVLDDEGDVVLANQAAGAVLGSSVEALKGSHFGTFLGSNGPTLMNVDHPDQGLRFIEVQEARAEQPADGRWHLVTFRDVTDEQLLHRREEDIKHVSHAISHDLREPVRMMVSYLDLIERRAGQELEGELAEFLDLARDGAHRLSRMLEGLLAYVRTEGQPPEPSASQLEEAVELALGNLQASVERSHLELTYDQLPTVLGDLGQLALIFQNLIANAIAYMPEGQTPRVVIHAEEKDGAWCIGVEDNGHGVPADHQDQIFDLFYRDRQADHPEGSGMGLAICKRIVENHGGRIWVESDPPDGATFWFTLPAVPDAPTAGHGVPPAPIHRPEDDQHDTAVARG